MNRLVLIGNGFDLAHKLPTSYQDFINWYWNYRFQGLIGNKTNVSKDILCTITCLKKQWTGALFFDYNLKNTYGIKLYNYLKSNEEEYKVELSPFMLLSFNYTKTPELYTKPGTTVNYIHGRLVEPNGVIFGYGDELDDDYKKLSNKNDNECLKNMKSIKYLESDNYRRMLEFIESAPFQVVIMGHSCGNSDRTLLNTIFEHRNCVSIKPYYYIKDDGTDNYLDLTMNISRNFTDMKLMRDRVVNKTYCEPLTRNN